MFPRDVEVGFQLHPIYVNDKPAHQNASELLNHCRSPAPKEPTIWKWEMAAHAPCRILRGAWPQALSHTGRPIFLKATLPLGLSMLEMLSGSCLLVHPADVSLLKHPSRWPGLLQSFNRRISDSERKSPPAVSWQLWNKMVRTLLNRALLLVHGQSPGLPRLNINVFFLNSPDVMCLQWLINLIKILTPGSRPLSFS